MLDLCYLLLHCFALPWMVWRRVRHGKHRRGLAQKMLGWVPIQAGSQPVVWLHAVSVGEVNLLPVLTGKLEASIPGHRMVVSTTTETGYDQAVRKFGAASVFFCPFDFSWAVRRAMQRIQPRLLVLGELELWPNLLAECSRRGVPVAVVNARMSDRSFRRFCQIKWLVRKLVFGRLDLVCAQSESYRRRFLQLGVPTGRVLTTGNLKLDGANTDREAPPVLELARRMGLDRSAPLFVAGSTQPDEDPMVIDAWQRVKNRIPGLGLAIVPRHPQNAEGICRQLEARGIWYVRRSRGGTLQKGEIVPADRDLPERGVDPVVVVDVIGELPAWWGLATAGYVGGSMGSRGGQSMIEPAALGVPVCFGPHTSNFRDIVESLLAAQAAEVVRDGRELEEFLAGVLADQARRAEMGARGRSLVLAGCGSAGKTALRLVELVRRENEADCGEFPGRAAA